MQTIKKLLREMFFENDELSLTRVISFGGYFLFAIGSLYLLYRNLDWGGYNTFASYTGGGGAALQFGNKFINSKYNSERGSYEQVGAKTTDTKWFYLTVSA